MVMVYEQIQGYNVALPTTVYNGTSAFTYAYAYKLNIIEFDIFSNVVFSTPTQNLYYKVVIASGNRSAYPNVNWDDYNSVKKAFNLKD
jgi:hypothetical protein